MPPRRSRQIRLSVTDKEYQAITDMTTPIRRTELLMREIERIQDDNISYGDSISLQMPTESVRNAVIKWASSTHNLSPVFESTSDLEHWAEEMLDAQASFPHRSRVTVDGQTATIHASRAGINYIIRIRGINGA